MKYMSKDEYRHLSDQVDGFREICATARTQERRHRQSFYDLQVALQVLNLPEVSN